MSPAIKRISITLLSGIIFMIFALYDNYPIVTSDTGAYIVVGFTLEPPSDRPVFYSLFLRATSLGMSLWLTVFVQCLILAFVVNNFIRSLIPQISYRHLIALNIFLSLATIAGWYAGQIMPDIFVSIMILGIVQYLLFENTARKNVPLLLATFLALIVHNSNYVIITLFVAAIFICSMFNTRIRVFRRKAMVLLCLGVGAWLTLCFSNYIGGKGFKAASATHVFVMGKLSESGVLKTYLDKACPIYPYKICAYKDNLPPLAWEFHWDANSPVQQTGGWDANKDEYNAIIKDIFSRPKYWPFLAYKSVEATARQLTLTNIDGSYSLPWTKFDEESSPYKTIAQYYPHELNEFRMSRQNTKSFNIGLYNNVYVIVIILSSLAVLVFISRWSNEMKFIYFFAILLIILNAFTTATLSSVNERLNSRVVWLIPCLNMLMICRYLYIRYPCKVNPDINKGAGL